MKSRRNLFILLLTLIAALVSTVAVLAQTPGPGQVTDDQVNAVAKELYCPVCENIPLDVCPTQACIQWRDLIRQKLSIGWSKVQIKEYFRQQYGDRVLIQTPTPSPVTDDQVNAVAKELYCPVCENVPLDVCSTQACIQWRDLIRQKLSIGWSKDQIKEYFRQLYGDRVAEPPRQGLNLVVYVLPPVCFLVGVYLVYRVLSKRKRVVPVSSPAVSQTTKADDPYLKQLEEELSKRK